jgi:hypothetical protein
MEKEATAIKQKIKPEEVKDTFEFIDAVNVV